MKIIRLMPVLLLASVFAHAQNLHVGVFGGAAAYNGDLVDKIFPAHGQTKGAVGIDLTYEYNDHINIRGGYTYAQVAGYDKFSDKASMLERNLSFQTSISEFSILGEYNIFNLYETRFTPYVYAGLAVFHYNPYANDANGLKTFLQPLSTEGEGLAGYPEKKPYSLTQPAVPLGIGFKYAVSDNVRIGIEAGYRKLFTDYLDDASTTYAAESDLLAAKGQKAVDMAYRGDEIPSGNPFPGKGAQRGNSNNKDSYYTIGLHLTFRLGDRDGGNGARSSHKNYGCPANMF
ncbi:MAG: DUF6089 family protein [Bacteroidota bacterium]